MNHGSRMRYFILEDRAFLATARPPVDVNMATRLPEVWAMYVGLRPRSTGTVAPVTSELAFAPAQRATRAIERGPDA